MDNIYQYSRSERTNQGPLSDWSDFKSLQTPESEISLERKGAQSDCLPLLYLLLPPAVSQTNGQSRHVADESPCT